MAGAKAKDFVVNVLADSSQAEKTLSSFASKASDWKGSVNTASNVVMAGAVGAVGASVHAAMQMDGVMDGIAQTTGASGAALDAYKDNVTEVAQNTAAPLEDIGSTMSELAQRTDLSGKSLEDVTHKLLTMQDFAGQTQVDVGDLTGAMSLFNIPASEMSGQLDTLYGISQNTGVSVANLISSVSSGGPALKGLGFSFEESAQMVGSLDKAGLDASKMTAGLSKGLVALAKSGEEPQSTFRRVVTSIEDLSKSGQDAAALDLSSKLFGTKAAPQFLEAIKSGALSIDQLTSSVGTSSDAINQMESNTEDFPESWEKFKNTATVALADIGEELIPKMNDGLTAAKPALMWFADHASDVAKVGVALVAVAGAAKGALIINNVVKAAKGLGTVINVAKTAMTGLNLSFSISPIGLVVTAVAALVAGLVYFFTQTETGRQAWAKLTEGFHSFIDWIGPAWSGLMNGIGGLWSSIWHGVTSGVQNVLSWLGANWPIILSILGGPIGAVVAFVITHWTQIKTFTVDTFNNLVSWVTGIPGRFMAGLAGLGQLAAQFGLWVVGAKDAAIGKFWELVGWVEGVPSRVLGALGDVSSLLWNAGTSIVSGLWEGLKSRFEDVKSWVGGIGEWIAAHKGPESYDRKLLTPNGGWIMEGLLTGIQAGMPGLGTQLAQVSGMIADSVRLTPTTLTAGGPAPSTGAGSFGSAALAGTRGGGGDTYNFEVHTNDPNLGAQIIAEKLRGR